MTDTDLHSIQTQATGSFLFMMGFNRHYPRVVCYGPLEFGGLTFRDLFTEQGTLRKKSLMEHIYHDTETGKMIMIALQSLQMEAGILAHLTDPTPLLVYTEPCWISATRDFMATHQLSLEFANSWNFRIARDHDVFLMDVFRNSCRWCDSDMRALNAVRLHLQVATLSDVCTADGRRFDNEAFNAIPSTTRTSTLLHWIRQPTVTDYQQTLWQQALSMLLDKYKTYSYNHLDHGTPSQTNSGPSTTMRKLKRLCRLSIHLPHVNSFAHMHPNGNETSPSDFFFDKDTYPMTSPPNYTLLAPVDLITDDDFSTITFSYRQQEKQKRHLPNTQKAYIKNLPKSRQRLLQVGRIRPSRTTNEFYALVMHTLITGGNFNCGTNGGLRINKGTFGFVVSTKDKIVWEVAVQSTVTQKRQAPRD